MCVGASDTKYQFATQVNAPGSPSNYGGNLDAILPGVNVWSASNEDDEVEESRTGTSFAAPQLAGIMAAIVGFEGINDDTAAVYARVKANQMKNIISGIPDLGITKVFSKQAKTPNLFSTSGIGFATDKTP